MAKWCNYNNCWCDTIDDIRDNIDEECLKQNGCIDYDNYLNCDLCKECEEK